MPVIYPWGSNGQPFNAEQLIRRAQDMIPAFRARVDEVNAARGLTEEVQSELRSSGLPRLLQPARFGGAEARISALIDVLIPTASGCPSTAWCLTQYILHNFMVARWPLEAQAEVWRTPDALVSGTIIPMLGRAVAANGGYLLSGRWPFVSGVQGSDWCLIAAMFSSENSPDEERYFLVRTADVKIVDTWFSVGLKGSGSQDVELESFFVSEAMSVPLSVFKGGPNPGSEVSAAPIFKMPVHMIFGLPHAACLVGIAESMYELFLSQSRERRSMVTGEDTSSYGTHQMAVGEISASLQAAQALLRADAEEMMHFADFKQVPSTLERSNYRCNAAYAGELARRAAHTIWDLVGARGAYETNPIARIYQDMLVGSRHVVMNLQVNTIEHGRARLRLPLTAKNL
ncbi:hypothetical protein OZ411_15255 [Bradyrhizobium sp. Arg237L]|uniref:hypothetical protein n=1 Tax=Bradyrhizobium sp. Arg237L TaxID=3003352 RepID=UPI00249F5EED|nr:hypothetical protein [Bradyrhizobium sp. Arg237L]MDI4234167.1 hypothetical protein [Bradyrhizobium sp. Arg237L]